MSNTRRPDQPGQAGYPPQQGQQQEEVLDGADLEFIDDQGPPTDPAMDPLDPGDTDPATSFEQQQAYTPTPLDPVPPPAAGYPVGQPQAPAYPAQVPGYPAAQQPAATPYPPPQAAPPQAAPPQAAPPQAATMPPDAVSYDQQQGYAQPGYPPQQQQQQQPAAGYPPPHLEDEPTSQQDQAAIQAAIDGKPYTAGPKLLIIGGNNRGKEFPLNHGGDTTIGRGVDNHIILADIAVSRKHTLVCHEGGQFVVRDLGSGNGTLLNGHRVDNLPLKDGDQLELGNTLMRYVNPLAAAQPQAPAPVAAPAPILQTATDKLDEGDDSMPYAAALAPAAAPQPALTPYPPPAAPLAAPAAPAPAGGMDRRRKLLIFGGIGLVAFFGILIGVKALIGGSKADVAAAQQGPSPDEVAAQEFQEGTTEFRAKNWEKAQTHFLKVLKLAPKFEDARRYAEQAASEFKAKTALDESDKKLEAKDFKAARLALTKVPSRSSYAASARKAKQKIDDEQLSYLVQEAKKLKEQGDITNALARATEARDLAPTNVVVRDLVAELSAAGPGTPTAVAAANPRKTGGSASPRKTGGNSSPRKTGGSTSRPRQPKVSAIKVSGGGAKQALALYKQQQWAQAFSSIKSYASAQSGSRKRKAESLADAIRKVGQNWIRAGKSSSAAQALKYYQQAMIYDRKVTRGGMHQAALKELIFKQARKESSTALARGKYTTAYAAYKLALRYGKEDAVLRKVASDLEKKAQALFTKGYTKRSSNIAYARKCWQQVLKMVPPSSSAYQKSYKWLNESTPSYEDEDED